MTQTSSVVFAGIAPHPPIMVPEVGREAIAEVRSSIEAMADLTARVISSGAETVVLISPHAPLARQGFVAYDGPNLYADFGNFRAPTAAVHAELDLELLNEITLAAAEHNLAVLRINGADLDHGSSVPLYFLQRNGWHGRLVALGYSFLSNQDHLRFGACIRQAIESVARPIAFIASGDLSHRLKVDAPAGYSPQAHLFDEKVVEAIRTGATGKIVTLDPELRRLAGECGYRSMLVAIGLTQGLKADCEVISYEAPFGVGYMVAQLLNAGRAVPSAAGDEDAHSARPAQDSPVKTVHELPALARSAVETLVAKRRLISAPDDKSEILSQRAGCFVSIKTHDGKLRGCVGTIDPVKNTLAEEVIVNAVSAATRDPRFRPIRKEELTELRYSVDVLSPPELVTIADLDPNVYGVIVEDLNGERRGLLLPSLKGIETPAQQLEAVSLKAEIPAGTEVRLWRFRSDRYTE